MHAMALTGGLLVHLKAFQAKVLRVDKYRNAMVLLHMSQCVAKRLKQPSVPEAASINHAKELKGLLELGIVRVLCHSSLPIHLTTKGPATLKCKMDLRKLNFGYTHECSLTKVLNAVINI